MQDNIVDSHRTTDGRRDGGTDGRMDGWTDGWMDGLMDGGNGGRDTRTDVPPVFERPPAM